MLILGRFNIFIPNGSLILKIFLSTDLTNFNNALRKILYSVELRMFKPSLFHLLMTTGKKSSVEVSVLQGIHGKCWSVCESFSFAEASYELVMVPW